MKNKRPNKKLIKDLAVHFDSELRSKIPFNILPNGNVIFNDYLVKQLPNNNWGLYHKNTKTLIDQFFLKSCSLMAAKAYGKTQLEKYFEVKRLDTRYWASYCDTQIYGHNIKTAKDFDRYLILLNKLEYSTEQTNYFKAEITRMFKWSFV